MSTSIEPRHALSTQDARTQDGTTQATSRVIVFGASGRVGRRIIKNLTARLSVTAFLRDGARFRADIGPCSHLDRIQVIEGDVLDADAVESAIATHDAVISCLGVRGFAIPGQPAAHGYLRAMDNIIAAASEAPDSAALPKSGAASGHPCRRFITVAVSGILPDKDDPVRLIRDRADYPQVFAPSSAAHLEVHRMLTHSSLEWTVVCPGRMPEGEGVGDYVVAAEERPVGSPSGIFTGDVADFIESELFARRFLRQRVGIAHRDALPA